MAKKYLLKRGFHSEHVYTPATEQEAQDDRIKTVFRRGEHVKPGTKSYIPGDTIETDVDLVAMFGREKFEEVHENRVTNDPWKDLEAKTTKQLKALAELEEIDLGDAKTKSEMVMKLKQAVGLLEPEAVEAD